MFYVYTRDGNWLEVGASTTKPDGWIKATDTTAWNQALTLLFTDRSQRQPVLFFKDHKAIMDVCQAEDLPGSLSKLRAEAKAAQQATPRRICPSSPWSPTTRRVPSRATAST